MAVGISGGQTSILTVLRERAGLQGDDVAVTYIDYDQNESDVEQSVTFSQLYRWTLNVARELAGSGSTGDRAVILAPQGPEYIAAFLGAMQAGRIAVPLSVPLGGVSDERVSSVLRDACPSVVLTTSQVAGVVAEHIDAPPGVVTPAIVEVDRLDLDGPASAAPGQGHPSVAYLQYTSGSTRQPAGVMMSHQNLMANFKQATAGYFADYDGLDTSTGAIVSWLPFYHDMGLYLGICAPVLSGAKAMLMSPLAFLRRPARWMQLLASHGRTYSAAPNFAFELAARKTTDEDMAGFDLCDVLAIITGAERVHPATLRRFTQRFAQFNLREAVIRPSYGLAEATVFVAVSPAEKPPTIVRFESEKLSAGQAERCVGDQGMPLVSYGLPESPTIRIVDPETCVECQAGAVGEIWVHGPNVAAGYWQKPDESTATFGGQLATPSVGTPAGPWLRTGDVGFIDGDELFVVGRIKDLLIIYGRNHSPDDIEATVQEISRGRCAAIAVPDSTTEKLVVIIETNKRSQTHETAMEAFSALKGEVATAISNAHGLAVADLVLVAPGSIPITTSGKIRRRACVERYQGGQFTRLDAEPVPTPS
ncbi:AMP-binding protein [Mycobacterium sp. 1274756.6]|uniref:AMP-binding protein n=1 Tax=Mycobacterium sp. 1274756.6 TaxID=1834076 RepID=UPI0007FF054C|nr:AMP-binding protein [Mycobacterium sp. 1274756.6]OBJ70860.1 acyl-CoA synthetase [Mycobacterium sp. 1274756.6]